MKLTPWKHRHKVTPHRAAESEKAFTVSGELPGVDEPSIGVQQVGNQLSIRGKRKWESKGFHRIETQLGQLERSIVLPTTLRLDPNAVQARMLEIVIPKLEATPATKIPVRPG